MAGTNAYNLQDLGSSPRSVQFLILFFNTDSYATLALRTTIFHPDQTIHASKNIRSRAIDQRTQYTPVNASYTIEKVNKSGYQMGLKR